MPLIELFEYGGDNQCDETRKSDKLLWDGKNFFYQRGNRTQPYSKEDAQADVNLFQDEIPQWRKERMRQAGLDI